LGLFITLFIRSTAESLQDEHHGRCFSASGAPNKYSESRHQNASADSPLPDAQDYDDGAVVCYAPVQYPTIQFTVAELRRRRKNGYMVSHTNKPYCLEKATRLLLPQTTCVIIRICVTISIMYSFTFLNVGAIKLQHWILMYP